MKTAAGLVVGLLVTILAIIVIAGIVMISPIAALAAFLLNYRTKG